MVRRPKRTSGFSLVEAVMAIVVLGIAIPPLVSMFRVVARNSVDETFQDVALAYANGLMEEIASKGFEDPDLASGSFGTEEGSRGSYDDVDDFDGLSNSPPEQLNGTDLDDFGGFTRSVVVENVTSADPDATIPETDGNTDLKRIEVTVAWTGGRGGELMLSTLIAKGSGPEPEGFGPLDEFALLAGKTVTVVPTGSVITGHVGVSPGTSITGIPAGATLTGNSVTHSNTAAAIAAMESSNSLYTALVDTGGATAITAELGGTTLTPGTYSFSSSANIAAGTTLTLDGAGVYIFKVGSAITANVGSSVLLQNGASPSQVFWQVTSAATLYGVTFSGTVVAQTNISLGDGATLNGRALTTTAGAVTLDGSNTVDAGGPIGTIY
ncbi:MAG: type II secretory pathway pseudopilin PulG [Chlamydiales bacterium]|jgi:type II secretory pathway pseudopilin PulG